ncbi:hypothetical protein J2Z52_001737 [Enterococcus rivorum]|nr:hypothetical protein [Enterococcus rivorum]
MREEELTEEMLLEIFEKTGTIGVLLTEELSNELSESPF